MTIPTITPPREPAPRPRAADGQTPNQSMAAPRATLVSAVPFTAAAAAGLLVPFEPRLALLVLVFVAFVARRMSFYDALLHVLLASVFVESVTVGPLRVGRVLALVAVGAIAFRMVTTSWRPPRLRLNSWMPAVLFMSWAWASGFWARDRGDWSFAMLQIALAVCFAAAFAVFVESADQVRRLLRTYVVAATFSGLLGIAQVFSSIEKGRGVGLQGDANIYALYQVAAVAACAQMIRTDPGRRRVWQAAMLVLLASVLASQSRGGLLSLAPVTLWILGARLRKPSGALAAVAAAVVGTLIVVSVPALSKRVSPSKVESDRGSGRIDIWYVAWKSTGRHPVLGLGGGNFKSHSIELLEREPGVQLIKSHLLLLDQGIEVHNVYLETLVDYGVPGAALFVTMLVVTAVNLRRNPGRRRRRGPPMSSSTAAVLASLTGMLVAFATGSVFLSIVNNKLLWALVGIAAARHARPRGAEPLSSHPLVLQAR
jgi:O-antigen ligase